MQTTFLLVPRAVRGFFLGGLALLLCSTAWATTFTVNATTDTGTGTGAAGDLRYCVAHATTGSDSIIFASTLSGATITLGSEIVFPNSSNVTLDGSGLASSIILSGNSAHRIFTINSGSAVLFKVLSFTAGNGTGASLSGNGGAIYNNGLLNLNGCTLYSNSATIGGGAIHNTGSLILVNCTIASNTASFAGGINHSTGSLVLIHSTVAGNTGSAGTGGIVLTSGTATFQNSIVAGNTAQSVTTDVDLGGSGTNITMTGNNLIGQNATSYNTGGLAAGTPNASGNYVGTHASPVAANLTTLGSNGGPVQTMPPSATSNFVIDKVTAGNVVSSLPTDARGNARTIDGDSNGTWLPDIGAVEFVPATYLTVSTTQDSVAGSLRFAIFNASQLVGAQSLVFSPSLGGQTITLQAGMSINNPAGLTVDASGLSGGLTIKGNGPNGGFAIFENDGGGSITLRGLTLTEEGRFTGGGGAISNPVGGTLTVVQCTLSNNLASSGGAIYNTGALTLTQCTLTGNFCSGNGGAIYNTGTLSVVQCTITGNTAAAGGGIFNQGTLTLTNSIVAGNTTGGGTDIGNSGGTLTLTGANFIGDPSGSGKSASSTLLTTATKGPINLAPLGTYGGATSTMPPLVGSPAINAAVGSLLTTDQRGVSITDGKPDLGAVEAVFAQVTNTNPSGTGSLVAAISTASSSGHAVSFASNLSGQTITLSGVISLSNGMIIDGGGLTSSVTLSGAGFGGSFNLFTNASGSSAFFKSLVLTKGGGQNYNDDGGAIHNSGVLVLTQCSLVGNTAAGNVLCNGGAIFNNGTLTLTQCTLSGNSVLTNFGGAIYNNGTSTLTQCTFSGNSAPHGNGGAINNSGALTLTQCTLSGNSAASGNGGGIYNQVSGALTLTNSIVAGNTATTGPDIDFINGGSFNTAGADFIGDLSTTNLTASSTILDSAQNGTINLATLGSYGGPTQTMPPLSGSPAINAAVGSTITTDQRGCPIAGTADLGAAECAIITPSPAQGGAITTLMPTFTWTGPAGVTFALAVGPSPTLLSVVGNSGSVSSFTFGGTLAPSTTYYWQVNATLGGVTFAGPLYNFTTPAFGATTVLSAYAVLNGSVNPGGQPTTAYFQYGTTMAYGSTSPVMSLGSGNNPVPVSFNAAGLTKGTTYHYRLVTVSGSNTINGPDQTFTTAATTSPANWHSAQISGLTNPSLNNMADGARTGVAHPGQNLYFYKGTDNNVWAVFLAGNTWAQQQLTTLANVGDWLAYDPPFSTLNYQGTDGNMWCVYYNSAAAQWTSQQLGTLPQGVTIAGDIVVDNYGGWNNIYYRGSDSHLYAVFFNGSAWVHVAIGGTATVKGSLAIQGNNHLVYYQGTDNNLWCFYYNGKVWTQLQLTTTGNVAGTVAVDNVGFTVYYKSNVDNSAWCGYSAGGPWTALQLDTAANLSASASSFSNIAPYPLNDCTVYLDNNGQCGSLYFTGSQWTHAVLGDGGSQITGGLSLQVMNHWLFARRSDGSVVIFYLG